MPIDCTSFVHKYTPGSVVCALLFPLVSENEFKGGGRSLYDYTAKFNIKMFR